MTNSSLKLKHQSERGEEAQLSSVRRNLKCFNTVSDFTELRSLLTPTKMTYFHKTIEPPAP